MANCHQCGNPIIFRYVDGVCTPIHTNDGCFLGTTGGAIEDYAGYREDRNSQCFPTNCPECGDDVFFIRHNGGCVWVDPPLGYPWYKHGCFDKNSINCRTKLIEINKRSTIPQDFWDIPGAILGVVVSTSVQVSKDYTVLRFSFGQGAPIELVARHNAGYTLGRLCFFDIKNERMCIVGEKKFFNLLRLPHETDP